MRHFVAYHNVDRMGQHLHEGDPLTVKTNKSAKGLLGHVVWFVVGEGSSGAKTYSLGSVFVATETGDTGEEEFKRFARGRGHVFQPTIPLNELDWFADLFRITAHFSLGVAEIRDGQVVAPMLRLAADAGCDMSLFDLTEPPPP